MRINRIFMKNKLIISILFLLFIFFSLVYFPIIRFQKTNILDISNAFNLKPKKVEIKMLFAGDIFLDRGIDVKSQRSSLKYAYPFSGLKTLEREKYDVWVGNLECPVTEEQSTMFEKEEYLKFSCKKEYLPELKKYFDIVSLANNHTDNMNGLAGLTETRKHLDDNKIKYFGDFDNSQTGEVCKIHNIKSIPIVFCGYNNVYKLPTDKELEIIKSYSKYFVTFIMPQQGEEYKFTSNTYQKKIYRKMIDNGADAIVGAHPHVIQEVEDYKGKKIFYSLGNFIFDQTWSKTREHMVLDTEIIFPEYSSNYANLKCEKLTSLECLSQADKLLVKKPDFSLTFTPIYTHSDLDFVTKKK